MKINFFKPAVMAAVASATMSVSSSDALALAAYYPIYTVCPCDLESIRGSAVEFECWRFSESAPE